MSTHTQEIDYDACDVGDGGFFDVYRTTTRTAAKLHRCYECDGVILPGDRYEVATMLYEGWWDTCRSCLACVEGEIHGFLDDGLGPAPDYIVRGSYFGSWFSGQGDWHARIFLPLSSSAQPVGLMKGRFADPPTSSGVGHFKGEWHLRQ